MENGTRPPRVTLAKKRQEITPEQSLTPILVRGAWVHWQQRVSGCYVLVDYTSRKARTARASLPTAARTSWLVPHTPQPGLPAMPVLHATAGTAAQHCPPESAAASAAYNRRPRRPPFRRVESVGMGVTSSMRPILMPARAMARRADCAPGPGVFVLLPPVARRRMCRAVMPSSCGRERNVLINPKVV